MEKLPKISVIIPVKPGREVAKALKALQKVDYSHKKIEIFLSFGRNPSRQRNAAVSKSKGEILYFLDNDAEIERHAFKRVVAIFSGRTQDKKMPQSRRFSFFPQFLTDLIIQRFFSGQIFKGEIAVVGGPSVWWRRESFWASVSGIVLESFFAHSKMAARYRPIGSIHQGSEKELILCNLAMRRDTFVISGGFNELLYPNEENELLNRIKNSGHQLVYHPGVLVRRPRRKSFEAIIRMFFSYGQSRAEHARVGVFHDSLFYLIPLFFLIYFLGLFFYFSWPALLPLVVYFSLAFFSALGSAQRKRKLYLLFFLPVMYLMVHLIYGLGLAFGLFTRLEKRKAKGRKHKVEVIKLKSFNQSF